LQSDSQKKFAGVPVGIGDRRLVLLEFSAEKDNTDAGLNALSVMPKEDVT
jgi:hypothetical protein